MDSEGGAQKRHIPVKTEGCSSGVRAWELLYAVNRIGREKTLSNAVPIFEMLSRLLLPGFHFPALIFFEVVCHIVIHRGLQAQEVVVKSCLTQLV
jgi:hypothetical protein